MHGLISKIPRFSNLPCIAKRTVLKPVPGSGSRAKCAQFRGSSDAKHVSSWFQPWATLWPTCHMLVPASLLQSVECSTECKNSIFHCTIGCNKYKSSLASGASPQTPPGGLFLPPGPPPPAWVHAAHRHGMVSPRKFWFQRPCSSLVLVPEEVVEPASGRYKRALKGHTMWQIAVDHNLLGRPHAQKQGGTPMTEPNWLLWPIGVPSMQITPAPLGLLSVRGRCNMRFFVIRTYLWAQWGPCVRH